MKNLIVLVGVLCVVAAIPVPEEPKSSLDLLQIPLKDGKELDVLSISEGNGHISERNKRTIDMLRQLFPNLSQIIQQKIQMILPVLIRTLGPILLRSGLGGGGGMTGSRTNADDDDDFDSDVSDNNSNERKVSVSLPVFEPGADDDDDDDENDDNVVSSTASIISSTTSTTSSPAVDTTTSNSITRINLLTRIDDDDDDDDNVDNNNDNKNGDDSSNNNSNDNAQQATTTETKDAQNLVAINEAENALDANAINEQLESIRIVRETASANAEQKSLNDDQQTAESQSPAIDELTLENEADDENRNKRFLSFGFGGSGDAAGGSSAGGSGNFLFDIIRSTADRAARAAGTVYRVVAGTEALGVNISASHRATVPLTDGTAGQSPVLVSGSSGTQQTDEAANAPDAGAIEVGKGDGYTEGIPGPVTRLFVLANRGLSNLIQDLILRIAQTSERVVNFKARLITSLI